MTDIQIQHKIEYLEGKYSALMHLVCMFIALHPHREIFLDLFDRMKEHALSQTASEQYMRGIADTVREIHELETIARAASVKVEPASG